MQVALFFNESKPQAVQVAKEVVQFLQTHHIEVVLDRDKVGPLDLAPLTDSHRSSLTLFLSIGGDGTLLKAAQRYATWNVPFLGINLGQLGFMADIALPHLYPSLELLVTQQFTVEPRQALHARGPIHLRALWAANDIVVHRATNYSLIELAVSVDGTYMNTFVADGLIIATPNGSTAYNLAAGGPILYPDLELMTITPISPHTISQRPLVLSSKQSIEIQYLSPYEAIDVRSDGLNFFPLAPRERVLITSSPIPFRLIQLKGQDYFTTLRTKLGWLGHAKGNAYPS
jgi:NAD+ kinase